MINIYKWSIFQPAMVVFPFLSHSPLARSFPSWTLACPLAPVALAVPKVRLGTAVRMVTAWIGVGKIFTGNHRFSQKPIDAIDDGECKGNHPLLRPEFRLVKYSNLPSCISQRLRFKVCSGVLQVLCSHDAMLCRSPEDVHPAGSQS